MGPDPRPAPSFCHPTRVRAIILLVVKKDGPRAILSRFLLIFMHCWTTQNSGRTWCMVVKWFTCTLHVQKTQLLHKQNMSVRCYHRMFGVFFKHDLTKIKRPKINFTFHFAAHPTPTSYARFRTQQGALCKFSNPQTSCCSPEVCSDSTSWPVTRCVTGYKSAPRLYALESKQEETRRSLRTYKNLARIKTDLTGTNKWWSWYYFLNFSSSIIDPGLFYTRRMRTII